VNSPASDNPLGPLATSRPIPPEVRVEPLPSALAGGGRSPGYLFFPRRSEPFAGPEQTVVVFHGIQSHPGWFVGSASYLAERGHTVWLTTRRGSGASGLRRGDAESPDQLLGDVEAAMQQAADRAGRPVCAVGISWGGKLLAAWALNAGTDAAGSLVLLAPGICPRIGPSFGQKLRIAWALVAGGKTRRFAIPLRDPRLFTANAEMLAYLSADAAGLSEATARFLLTSRLLDRRLAAARAGAIDLPVALLLASEDRILDNAATEAAVARLCRRNPRIRTLPGAHTLEFEPRPEEFYRALAEAVESGPAPPTDQRPTV
jgi:alpha-beta hydrolase superfamily lysophospholipase